MNVNVRIGRIKVQPGGRSLERGPSQRTGGMEGTDHESCSTLLFDLPTVHVLIN